ncbi:MAG: hypothetical protein IMX02_12255 [Limnochordaceae bacterium]|nr:hypothetical protein [Limnochordaceae bacterium]
MAASGQRGRIGAIRSLLARHLSAQEMAVLGRLLDGWRINPFEWDRETGRCEVGDAWMWRLGGGGGDAWLDEEEGRLSGREEPADGALEESGELDVLLRACEVLTEHACQLRDLGVIPERPDEGGQLTLSYEFTDAPDPARAGNLDAGARFAVLLKDHQGFRVVDEDLGGIRRLSVTFSYRNDADFGSKKGQLDWLRELARRLSEDRPYRGDRV